MAKMKKATRKYLTKSKANGGKALGHKKHVWKRQAKGAAVAAAAGGAAAADARDLGKKVEDMDVDEFLAGDFLDGYGEGASEEDAAAADAEDVEGGDEDGEDVDGGESSYSDGEFGTSDEDEDEDVGGGVAGGEGMPAAAPRTSTGAVVGGADGSDDDDDDGGGGDDGGDDDGGGGGGGDGDVDEEAGVGGVRAQNRRLADEIASHRAQLEKLRRADPEFYAYLAATDKQLLAFGQGEEEEEEEEDDESSEGREEQGGTDDAEGAAGGLEGERAAGRAAAAAAAPGAAPPAPSAAAPAPAAVTLDLVDSWSTAALGPSPPLGAVRSLLRAYRVACHYGDSEERFDEGMRIGSSAVFNRLMLFVLKEGDGVLRRMLGVGSRVDAAALAKAPRWRKVEPLVKSYMGNTLHLLGQMTESTMLAFILRRVRASAVLLAPYDKLQRRYLRAALTLFGSAEAAPRVQAALLVRQMALALPQPSMDACLKGAYRAFSANAKFVNAASVPHINFMASCVVELYGLDPGAAYRHAFGFVRQLALLLRQALTAAAKDSYREVYCWQTVNCLELWAKVLAAHAEAQDLRPLVYPVVQLLLGAARLVPTPGYFPLRLRLCRALNRLAQATGVYVPLAPLLLEVLQWGDLSRAPRPAPGDKPPELLLQLRAGKASMRGAAYQEEVVETALELLADHLGQWACHVAFPELAHLPLTQLRRFAKATPVERFRRGARQLADAIERNIQFVGRARDQVDFAPKDLQQAAAFLAAEAAAGAAPVQQHAATLRDRAKQRLALRMARDVQLGGREGGRELDGGVDGGGRSDSDEELPEPRGSLLPRRGAAAAAAAAAASRKRKADEASAAEEEEEAKEAAQRRKGKGVKGKAAAVDGGGGGAAAVVVGGEDGEDELLGAYEPSDEEEDGRRRQPLRRSFDEDEDEDEEDDDENDKDGMDDSGWRGGRGRGGFRGRGGGGGRGRGRGSKRGGGAGRAPSRGRSGGRGRGGGRHGGRQ